MPINYTDFGSVIVKQTSDTPAQGYASGSRTPLAGDVARFLATENITVHARYGFLDRSIINYAVGGAVGHASFDSATDIQGSANSDHHHSFQCAASFSGSGTLSHWRSYESLPSINGPGTTTDAHGFSALTPGGSGPITTYYGFYAEGDPARAGTCWAFYSSGTAPSRLGGLLRIIAPSTTLILDNTLAAAAFRVAIEMRRGGTTRWALAFDASDRGAIIDAAMGTANLWWTDAGAFTMRGALSIGASQVLTARQTGWVAATGTPTRSTFATGSVTLPVLAEHVKALIDDLMTHGVIGT